MSLIQCKNIFKRFDRFGQTSLALDDVSFTIGAQDCVGFLGKSGSGKSTLIRCLLGIDKVTSGQIHFNGKSFSEFTSEDFYSYRQKVAWISQDHHLLSSKTVFENIALPLRLQSVSNEEVIQRVMQMLDYLGLSDKKDFYPSQLSGGQQQRVSIGRALIKKPILLFCDEPTSALDAVTTKSIVDLLEKLKKELCLAIVFVTHQEILAENFCERIIRISEGKATEQSSLSKKLVSC